MTKRAKSIIAISAGVILVGIEAFLIFLGPAKAEKTRKNVLTSARYYLANGDYSRALDLIDKLLSENATDPDARDLREKAMQAKSGADSTKAKEAALAEASGQKAIAQSLDKLGQKLKTTASSGTTSSQGSGTDIGAKARAAATLAAKNEAAAQKKS